MRFYAINTLKKTRIPINSIRLKSGSTTNIWKSVVGLEVHAQLNTESKLFSRAQNTFGGAVNNCVSYLDASIPGTLPVLNRKCVELGIKTALALSCKVNEVSSFDRKHYFYADLPAGYQITQQRAPLASDGVIHFQVYTPGTHKKPYKKSSKIKQIQLEQDSGKSLHDDELKRSLVDLNRAGAPLIELVFEPDLSDGEEAAALVKELLLIVQRLQACSGKMEEGALRVDANVSLHKPGEPLGTRTEIKNIGSVRGVAGAISYEISRQMAVLNGGGVVANETRSWDAVNRLTVPMRDKEVVLDYRYMPEPNLPPLRVNLITTEDFDDVISVPILKQALPGLPEDSRKYLLKEYNLKTETAIQLVNEPVLLEYFLNLATLKSRNPFKIANLLLNDLLTVLNKKKIPIEACTLTTTQLGQMIDFLLDSKINLETCRIVIADMLETKSQVLPSKIIEQKGLWLVSDDDIITQRCLEIMHTCPTLVKKYKGGKVKIFKALLGMIASKYKHDKIDMKKVSIKLEELLKK